METEITFNVVNGNENNVDFQNDNNIKRNDFSQQFIKARTF